MKLRVIAAAALLPLAISAYADEPSQAQWTGRADLGYFSQSGSGGGKESLTAKVEAAKAWMITA